ncbi:GntR family transcriptional regulator [Gemelliphila palaticanis]|uniref:GntR family transcriptional regulator n=1 Tax=Gemelliphila palaticanis TaxID=81950 RepID=A0ABX2SYM5_9BACL|nr:GntR family transcriptional regulator [Gemella palaticanis]MBF0715384.1 GntR family transcriptional regulator [Gemella palaticanis]NYS47314.1 GntR family transcriptional regulator [Gemella palaticanis]
MKKYEQIINDIILKIESGIFKEGEQIYTEKEIKDIYNVSSTTAVRVLNELVTSGYIYRVQGKGSFVSKTLVNKKIYFTEKNNFKHYFSPKDVEKSQVLSVDIIEDEEICIKFLNIRSQKLVRIKRVKFICDVNWAYQINYIPLSYLPGLDISDVDNFKELATMIRKKYRIDIHKEKFTKSISVTMDAPDEIKELIAPNNEPCFEFDRCTYHSNGDVFEYVKIYINYKYYKIKIHD